MDSQVKTLIDKAVINVGSEAKLARALGIPQTHVTMWKSGVRTCTPPDRARLAGFAGEDATQELVRATIEQSTGTRKEQLEKVLGKLSRQTGAALHTVGLGLGSLIFGLMLPTDAHAYFIRCILC